MMAHSAPELGIIDQTLQAIAIRAQVYRDRLRQADVVKSAVSFEEGSGFAQITITLHPMRGDEKAGFAIDDSVPVTVPVRDDLRDPTRHGLNDAEAKTFLNVVH